MRRIAIGADAGQGGVRTGVGGGGPGRAPLARRGLGAGRRVVRAAGLLVAVVAGAPRQPPLGHAAPARPPVLAATVQTITLCNRLLDLFTRIKTSP